MSPEYNFYVKANLPGAEEAGELVASFASIPGVEVVQMQQGSPYILVRNPNTDRPSVGKIIREARLSLGLRQIDIANAVGINNSSLSAIENNRIRSSRVTLSAISDALGFAEDDPRREELLVGSSPNLRRRRRVIELQS